MCTHTRLLLVAIAILVVGLCTAQQDGPTEEEQPTIITAEQLQDFNSVVPGMGRQIPGIYLSNYGLPCYHFGDDGTFASRDLNDSGWVAAGSWYAPITLPKEQLDTAQALWVRYHLLCDSSLRGSPLTLSLGSIAGIEIFLNGHRLVHVRELPPVVHDLDQPIWDTLRRFTLPITFACQGEPEVLAIRIDPARNGIPYPTLHYTNFAYNVQLSAMHYGVFIGVNAIIFLLALVLWSLDRNDKQWWLLALLAFVTGIRVCAKLTSEMGLLGLPWPTIQVIGIIDKILLLWPMYVLIMVLWRMLGGLSSRRAFWLTFGVLFVSATSAGRLYFFGKISWSFSEITGEYSIDAGLSDDQWPLLVALVVGAVLRYSIALWFAIELIRLGIRLVRKKGFGRWIGAGALVSSLLSFLLTCFGLVTEIPSTTWLTLSDYLAYVAVPVSVVIYLAVTAAQNNKLVARQRDDLDREVDDRTAELVAEKQAVLREKERSDELLLNILPSEVAEELKANGSAKARDFDPATILFTDFKGFTELSVQLSAQDLVAEINTCFEAFDGIISRYGVEKIKTIGDAYMAAGGVPDPLRGSPAGVVEAALEMQEFMVRYKAQRTALNKPAFEMRLGVHTGPVVAGIVGVKKFQYDIWGDTVNTASRMESNSEVGQVNISQSTYELVKNVPGLAFTSRGKIPVKGKGELEMYFVKRGPVA
ncbi:MAG: hypothetical protein IPH21_04295 [Flavobacteriales bacterium]|nr:hypothetical protein [Flavobacteriales bacterium]HQV51677.1 adenylate/guanylate cyclase domain-containing protein [Flavobacteriales bacterium]HQX37741.1 adenylate/guanylate cyclase domain-containing protein [Flavobacteriales bacterium]